MAKYSPKILVVDDNEDNRYTLHRRLKKDGYSEISLANGGQEALDIVYEESFDLILLDLMMPDISGLEVLQQVKSDPDLRHIPVIMVTASDDVESAAECIQSGADDYITKPINATLLNARVSSSLDKKRVRDLEASYLGRVEEEKKKTNDLLHSVLPKGTVGEIKSASNTGPKRYDNVAILICDLVGFTPFCEQNSPEWVVDTLQDVFEQFEAAIEETGMEKIKTVGDAIVATSGILTDNHEPVLTAVECGILFRDKANAMNPSWDVHVGIHYGPVVAGIVGRQSLQFDMLGHTLNTTFRICDTSEKNEILISNDAWMTVRGKLRGKSRGLLELKGEVHVELLECLGLRSG